MADKICHLCQSHYIDDPFLTEHPGHTPEQCLAILQYRYQEAELNFREIERQFVRAKLEYIRRRK